MNSVPTDIMIDMETLATTPDACILSIGAVKLNMEEVDDTAFHAFLSIDYQRDRRISHDTLSWWMTQNAAAQSMFAVAKADRLVPFEALDQFCKWVQPDNGCNLWSNGADFDIPILRHAMESLGMEYPLKYSKHRCFRTYKAVNSAVPPPEFTGTQHDALADALHQAKWLQAMMRYRATGELVLPDKGFGAAKK